VPSSGATITPMDWSLLKAGCHPLVSVGANATPVCRMMRKRIGVVVGGCARPHRTDSASFISLTTRTIWTRVSFVRTASLSPGNSVTNWTSGLIVISWRTELIPSGAITRAFAPGFRKLWAMPISLTLVAENSPPRSAGRMPCGPVMLNLKWRWPVTSASSRLRVVVETPSQSESALSSRMIASLAMVVISLAHRGGLPEVDVEQLPPHPDRALHSSKNRALS
jgi:hypothetical protein